MIDTLNTAARKVPAWVLYILLTLPIPFLFYSAATGGMGVEPINALEREMGELSLKLIIFGLLITPLRKYLKLNLLKFRRAIGVMAFVYVAVHLGIWVVLDMSLRFDQMWSDIWKRPYITIGMVAFIAMIPLAVTSNNLSVRKMGGMAWRKLHKLVYPIAVLGAVHFIMVQKVWEVEPMVYLAVVVALIGTRYVPSIKARLSASV
ncbi:protein-methionine-sulfoxide reductase heme-binding subunit MsrQ [Octadecabacter sp. 1_MG-2023]|uniref:protein-methionine-sulfoxide reductase heme-binding subunit MsrQ n=1 Tax=unclassified Octadecabacter TaxID=196158 RepID=UPI001C08A5BE|nr:MULTISPECIES: protein-methionine-sulfoxide reductase heme-binding subunit MsrQ [unclassified Octadecabacter]MBU2992076.1 protein-methionine-sulfoxide reductase heme-binding subunit MsrQ [Octadecabacter sp. B2R22]MDO6735167.1 protein-methionine-sulfoxide reductase heme-binding subunit MsrQ [Octadecabacter sp. 1_MG-2023]